MVHSAYATSGHGGREVQSPYWRYGGVQTEERGLQSKVEQLFVWEIWKIDMEVVWDTEGEIPTVKVTREGNDHCQRLGTSEARDLSWGSRSQLVRPKAG